MKAVALQILSEDTMRECRGALMDDQVLVSATVCHFCNENKPTVGRWSSHARSRSLIHMARGRLEEPISPLLSPADCAADICPSGASPSNTAHATAGYCQSQQHGPITQYVQLDRTHVDSGEHPMELMCTQVLPAHAQVRMLLARGVCPRAAGVGHSCRHIGTLSVFS